MNPFRYERPNGDQIARMEQFSNLLSRDYDWLLDNVSDSAERTLAIRKLQEARMWANVAILELELSPQ